MDQKPKIVNITIAGSTVLMADYILFATNQILYINGVDRLNDFKNSYFYGLKPLILKDKYDTDYFNRQREELKKFLTEKVVEKVTLILLDQETRRIYEEWHFEIDYDKAETSKEVWNNEGRGIFADAEDERIIQRKILSLYRQILESVNVLPILDCDNCAFDIEAKIKVKFSLDIYKQWTLLRTLKLL
ncbi:uncharacterized protein LOC106645044 [Copidosoma floridanum]|uniref:uncharacterized protein LOC106645044 n=1 Tax=Copidosoma floridanum TaxID=29053 RepID=UPI0006C9CE2D|nr:uncharacterized protein LOC106645044 [Copidosoma floridanum]XP_014216283.1 uncharacterized protein LOC106645044 [Copidosoma floridanum]